MYSFIISLTSTHIIAIVSNKLYGLKIQISVSSVIYD